MIYIFPKAFVPSESLQFRSGPICTASYLRKHLRKPARGEPPLEDIVANTLIGAPEKIAEQLIERIRVLKPSHVNTFHASGSLPHLRVMKSIERFMTEVVPMVEAELGPLGELGVASIGQRAAIA